MAKYFSMFLPLHSQRNPKATQKLRKAASSIQTLRKQQFWKACSIQKASPNFKAFVKWTD